MNRFGPLLMHHLDQLLELIDFNSRAEVEYFQIAQGFEKMRQQCCQLDRDLRGARQELRQSEYQRSVLEVKLKHARNQLEVEMKKRHWAEAELEKQKRKLQLISDYLSADPLFTPLSEDQSSALAVFEKLCFSHSSLLPGKRFSSRLSAVEEFGTSVTFDISFDHSDEEVAKELPVLIRRSRVIGRSQGPAWNLSPISMVSRRRSKQNHSNPELTSAWSNTGESGGQNNLQGSEATGPRSMDSLGTFTLPPPPGNPHLQQHQFVSKTVICLESCTICKSRLRFGRVALKCRPCQLLIHPECKEHCPSLCRPGAHPKMKEGILADFVPAKPPLVPPIVIQCVAQVEKRGLKEAGLYRVPGAEHLVQEWKHKLLCAQGRLPSLDAVADVNVICGILKDFLRSLKEPLLTVSLHAAFLHAAEILDESACHTELCRIIMKLPLANRDTLAFLMLHLHRVTQSPECQMDCHNLASIFGPTLVGHSVPGPSPLAIMEDTPRQCLVVSHLLALPLKFWKHFIGEEQETLVPSVQQTNVMNEQGMVSPPKR